jgi:hypothetical protein
LTSAASGSAAPSVAASKRQSRLPETVGDDRRLEGRLVWHVLVQGGGSDAHLLSQSTHGQGIQCRVPPATAHPWSRLWTRTLAGPPLRRFSCDQRQSSLGLEALLRVLLSRRWSARRGRDGQPARTRIQIPTATARTTPQPTPPPRCPGGDACLGCRCDPAGERWLVDCRGRGAPGAVIAPTTGFPR